MTMVSNKMTMISNKMTVFEDMAKAKQRHIK